MLEADGAQVDLVGKTPEAIVDLGIALVPEGRRLFPALSVEENLMLGAYPPGGARATSRASLAFVYATFPVLRERRRQQAGSMSGGEQQMVALGRALMSAPKHPAGRRALGRPRPDPGQPGDRQDQGAQGAARA